MALTTVLSKDDCHTTGIRQQAPGSTQVLSSVWLSVAVLSMLPCRFFASPRLIICAIRPQFGLSWISLASQNILMLRKMDDTQCPACEAMPKADVQGAYWQAPRDAVMEAPLHKSCRLVHDCPMLDPCIALTARLCDAYRSCMQPSCSEHCVISSTSDVILKSA